MLELRSNREYRDADLSPGSRGARIRSCECAFRHACAGGGLTGRRPNCREELARRLVRPAERLARGPACSHRVLKVGGRASLALLLVLGLAACAEKKPPEKPAPPVVAAPQGVSGDFEVLYRGASTRYQVDDRNCPSPGLVAIRPEVGAFTYRLGGRVRIETTIIGDGTLVGQSDGYTITGTATERKIEGDVKNGKCAYHFRAFRKS